MSRYIDAENLKAEINDDDEFDGIGVKYYIDHEPTADVQEVKHGKWLLEKEPNGKPYCFHCSVCDDDFHCIGVKTAYDFCPNCGAKMDKEGVQCE